jgi:hypothetical protein
MLGKELHEGVVPKQRPVPGVEDTDGHFELVKSQCNQAQDGDQRFLGKRRNRGIIGEVPAGGFADEKNAGQAGIG